MRLALGLILLAVLQAHASAGKRPFTLEDALALEVLTFSGRNGVSPDGRWIAYAVTDGYHERSGTELDSTTFAAGSHVRVRSLERNEVLEVTSGATYSWAPVWSPDGRRLGFYLWHDRSIAVGVWSLEDRKLIVLRAPNLRGRGLMQWHPSGRWLVCPTRRLPWGARTTPYDPGRLVNVIESTTEPQPYDAVQIEARASGLIAIEVETGRARTIVAPDVVNLVFALSPDGRQVAALGSVSNAVWVARMLPVNNLSIFPWEGGPAVVLFEGTTSQGFSWRPDGKEIALIDRDALWILDVGSGTSRRIAPAGLSLAGQPLWDRQGRSVVCQAGSDLVALDPSTLRAENLTAGLPGIKSNPQWSADGTLWFKTADPDTGRQGVASAVPGAKPVQRFLQDAELRQLAPCAGGLCFTLQTIATPENIWRLEATTGRREQLTDTNAHTRDMSFGAARLMRWQGAGGEQLKGVLLLPTGYREGTRYPVVVWVYETFSANLHVFELHLYNLQTLANAGYAVLMPDVQFREGETARSYENCVPPALDKLVEAGIADGRFGLMGHSFGGFATNILVTRSDRFKAAVAIAGISDWVSFSGYPGDFMRRSHEQGQGRLGGPLSDDPRRYTENSPVFYLDKVATPLMIIHGMEDRGVPFQQAEAMYYGLRRLGKVATLVAYPGEDHLYWNTQRAVLRDMWNRILSWFELHLANR